MFHEKTWNMLHNRTREKSLAESKSHLYRQQISLNHVTLSDTTEIVYEPKAPKYF